MGCNGLVMAMVLIIMEILPFPIWAMPNQNNNANPSGKKFGVLKKGKGGKGSKICFQFQRSGTCSRDECPFAHVDESQQPPKYNNNNYQEDMNGEENQDGDGRGPWLPPGADVATRPENMFANGFDTNFIVPNRLATKSAELIGAVNDFHFAMVNDLDRNEFYKASMEKYINKNSRVLEIGTGSGVLSMIAAKMNPEWVVAVEANRHMAELAQSNIEANGLSHKIRILKKLSTELTVADLPGRPNVLVSELFGTLLLGESALDYIFDARERILQPGAAIVPPLGVQMARLIECPTLESITSVSAWDGLDLRKLNALQDTASVVFTKQYGFRFSTVEHKLMADTVNILDVDFTADNPKEMEKTKTFKIKATHTGRIHAVMLCWEAYTDFQKTRTMSTAPEASTFARDMQWGQALQLVEDMERGDGRMPMPVMVTKGEPLLLVVRFSGDGVVVQFEIKRDPEGQA